MKEKKQILQKNKNWPFYVSILVISSVALVIIALLIHIFSNTSIREHAFYEMNTTTTTQAAIIDKEIARQYQPLEIVAGYVENGMTFNGGESLPVLEAIMRDNSFCMLGYADKNGNAVTYNGESMGSLAYRDYISEILSGEKTSVINYLEKTVMVDEPRFVFSVPVYDSSDNEKVTGVIFASKKDSVLADVLLGTTMFDGSEEIMITDSSYMPLVANEKGAENISGNGSVAVQQQLSDSENTDNKSSSDVFLSDSGNYIARSELRDNGWMLFCVLSEDTINELYKDTTDALKKVADTIAVILFIVLAYTIIMSYYRISRYKKGEQWLYKQYHCYHALLEKMDCALLERPMDGNILIANDIFMKKYGKNISPGTDITMSLLKEIHPEFNFKELEICIEQAKKDNNPNTFEAVVTPDDGNVFWIEITVVPISDLNGKITDIMATIVDTTESHLIRKHTEMIDNIPNGIHRCVLSDPVHLEYVGTGMLKMLDYTQDEFNAQLGPESKLTALIHPLDKEKFCSFIEESRKKEGNYRCEYRLRRKDGSYILVLDVMEVKNAASGVIYGYSSVTDISYYHQAKNAVDAELYAARTMLEAHVNREEELEKQASEHQQKAKDLEDALQKARLQNSVSQMQPHFLYNALASIREIVLDDPQYASDLIYDFSTHLRGCIRAMSNQEIIPFEQELNNINAYVNIEKMRFGKRLNTILDIKDSDFDVAPLSIQPLVENAIRHGIYQRGAQGGTVMLKTEKINDAHCVYVIDDGVGFDYDEVMKEIHEGRDSAGLENLIFRLKEVIDAEVTIESTIGVGTKISIKIPIKKEGVNGYENHSS